MDMEVVNVCCTTLESQFVYRRAFSSLIVYLILCLSTTSTTFEKKLL